MDPPALLRAFKHYKAGRLDQAAELLPAFLGAAPRDASANHPLGGIYYRQGKHAAASELLDGPVRCPARRLKCSARPH
jgi:TolA-binding protein